MGPFKLGVVSIMALAVPAGVAVTPRTAMADATAGDSGGISAIGAPDSASGDSLLSLVNVQDNASVPESPALTADNSSVVDSGSSGAALSEIAVRPLGDIVPANIPEPAGGAIALIAGLGILLQRRRKSQA